MRDPSLHIKLSDLATLLESLGQDSPKELANTLIMLAHEKGYQRRDRVLVTTTASKGKTLKKVVAKPNADDTNTFGSILEITRRRLKHKLVQSINPQSKDYNVLKEVAQLAHTFVQEFQLSKELGYQKFIELGIALMRNKYGLNKFKYYGEKIFELQETYTLVTNDDNPLATEAIALIYNEFLQKEAGLTLPFAKENYSEWVNFYYTRLDCKTYNASPKDWIKAQFDGLAFMSAVPELSQLYGDNAYKRYISYLSNKATTKKSTNPQPQTEEPVKDAKLKGYFDKMT